MSKKTYNSPRLNGQFPFCSFPFALDTYNSCTHLCKYCFSYFNYLINSATQGQDFFKLGKELNLKPLENAFEEEKEKDSKTTKTYRKLINLKMPIHWGGISDPFSNFEKESDDKVSLKCLKLFNKHQYPVICSTKSSWLVDNEEYLKEIRENKNFILQVSLISLNNKMKTLEPGTSIEGRLKLIKEISKTNRVIVRMQPYIPEMDTDEEIEKFLSTIKEAGATAITIEILKISAFQTDIVKKVLNEMSDILGYDILKYYKFKGEKTGTDFELKFKYKLPIITKVRDLSHKVGLEFYCADNALRDYGDSPICCGLPLNYPGFENSLKAQSSVAIFKAKEKGFVYFDDIFENMGEADNAFLNELSESWLNLGKAENHIRYQNKTFLDRAKFIWDNPRSQNNPATFFNNLEVAGKDKNGHLFYKYIKQ